MAVAVIQLHKSMEIIDLRRMGHQSDHHTVCRVNLTDGISQFPLNSRDSASNAGYATGQFCAINSSSTPRLVDDCACRGRLVERCVRVKSSIHPRLINEVSL